MLRTLLGRAALLCGLLPAIFLAPDASAQVATYAPVGPQTNVPAATVTGGGWVECHREKFNAQTSIATISAACNKAQMMMACSNDGSTLQVLAQAPKTDVMFDTGTGNVGRQSNGTTWYFNGSYSWGFAPGGAPLNRSSCDAGDDPTFSVTPDPGRMCIHTAGGSTTWGWRCGTVNGNTNSAIYTYDRVFYHADGAVAGATAPGAPTAASATAGDTQATVSFSAPASDGGSAITGYRVVSSPGNIEASGSASPITVTGLTNGTSYTFTVIATNAVGDSLPSAPSNAVVPKGSPTLSGFPDIGKTWGDADFALVAPGSDSDGAFSYTSSDPAVATISGDIVTITGVGSATITANQAPGSAHVAGSTTATLTVAKANPVITWMAPLSKTWGDADFVLDVPASNSSGAFTYASDNAAVATVSGNTVTITGAGSATLTVTQAADAHYEAGSATVSLDVAKAAAVIAWMAPISKVYGDPAFALDAPTSNSTGAFTFSSDNAAVATVSGSTVTITGAGSATLTVEQAADANHEAGSATVSLTVARDAPSLGWLSPINKTYGDADFVLDPPSSNSSGSFTFSSADPSVATVSGNTVTITGAGTTTLTAAQAADANYDAATTTVTLTVAKATPTLSWIGPVSKTYGDADFALDPPTSNSTGAFTYGSTDASVATVSGNTVSLTGAGSATLTVNQAADDNFEAASATTSLSVGQATPVITWVGDMARTWGDPGFELPTPSSTSTGGFTFSSDNAAVATVSGNTVTLTGAGTAILTATQAADANHVSGSVTLVLTVGKAAPDLEWIGDISKTYGEPAFDLPDPTSPSPGAFTFASANAGVATISGRTVTIVGDGIATLTVTQAETANFQAATASLQLVVSARPDPRDDPGVVAGLQAQVDASVRFAAAQQSNVRDRLRQVRSGANANSNGLALKLSPGAGPGLGLSAGQAAAAPTLALPEGWGWWTAGAITFGDRSPGAGSSDFGFHSDGISLGADRKVGENVLLGFAFGMGWNDTDFDRDNSSLAGEQRALSVYGLWRGNRWFVDGLLGLGELDFDIRRYSALVNEHAVATRGGEQTFGSLTLGYEHAGDASRLVGYARLDASRSELDAYRETGLGIYDLSYSRQTVENSSVSLGVEGGHQWDTSSGVMRPYWMLEYRHAVDNRSDVGINYVVLPNATDYVLGMRSYADDALVWGGGIDLDISPRWGLSLLYRGERLRDGDDAYGVGLTLSYRSEGPAAAVQPVAAGSTQATATSRTTSR